MNLYNYKNMANLKEQLNSFDISYYGVLTLNEKDITTDKDVINSYDVYVSIEEKPNMNENEQESKPGYIYKFYNKDGQLLAINFNNEQGILPEEEFADVLTRENLEQLYEFSYSQENSFNKIDMDLEKISKASGKPKEDILAVAETDELSNDSKENPENDEKIHLKDEKNKNDDKQNTKKKAKIEALEIQSTPLNQLVTETETLGDILGIHEGGKLVAVYSDSIENGTKNNTRFTFLLKDADGNYSEIPNIEQAGGINPNTAVAQSNENGDNVKKEDVNSIYRIKGPGNIEYLLTANIGPYGTIELGIGQRDKTQGIDESDLVTTPLKTSSTYYTNRQTREAINSSRHGTKQATERSREADTHDGESCNLTKDEVDGNTNTGHQHISTSEYSQSIADIIINNDDEIDGVGDHLTITNVYNRSDIQKIVKSVHEENHELSYEELIKVATEIIKSKAAEQLLYGHIRDPRSYDNVS